jgi:hypothetical protein
VKNKLNYDSLSVFNFSLAHNRYTTGATESIYGTRFPGTQAVFTRGLPTYTKYPCSTNLMYDCTTLVSTLEVSTFLTPGVGSMVINGPPRKFSIFSLPSQHRSLQSPVSSSFHSSFEISPQHKPSQGETKARILP